VHAPAQLDDGLRESFHYARKALIDGR